MRVEGKSQHRRFTGIRGWRRLKISVIGVISSDLRSRLTGIGGVRRLKVSVIGVISGDLRSRFMDGQIDERKRLQTL